MTLTDDDIRKALTAAVAEELYDDDLIGQRLIEDEWPSLLSRLAPVVRRLVEQTAPSWQSMETAPKDGSPILAHGLHTHSPADAQRGVKAGDWWVGVLVWDIWRSDAAWVFAKDGALAWSVPSGWMPLPAPPKETP
jgi:hypothetical protein